MSVTVFGYDLRYAHGEYVMSGGRTISSLPSTVVRIETDDGVTGYGESCPLGSTYLPAHAAGARAAIEEIAPHLIGVDATNLAAVWDAMDGALAGHLYAKSAIDIACWDVLGKAANVPVSTLLGGARGDDFPLYVAIPLGPIDAMVAHVQARKAEGTTRFQLKLGADPREDARRVKAVLAATSDDDVIIADANGGWRLQDATIAARALEGLDRVLFEQPCPTLEECLAVRERTTLPMVLDEVITDVNALLRARPACDGVNLKLGRVGGLTKAKLLRDLGQELGLRFTIEDSLGRRPHDGRGRPPRRQHPSRPPADGELHERLDARSHRGPSATVEPRPRRGADRPRPRHHGRRGRAEHAENRRMTRAGRCPALPRSGAKPVRSKRSALGLRLGPPRLARIQGPDGRATLRGRRAVDHQHAVEVVELVLENAGVGAGGFDPHRVALGVLGVEHDVPRALDLHVHARLAERKTALEHRLALLAR